MENKSEGNQTELGAFQEKIEKSIFENPVTLSLCLCDLESCNLFNIVVWCRRRRRNRHRVRDPQSDCVADKTDSGVTNTFQMKMSTSVTAAKKLPGKGPCEQCDQICRNFATLATFKNSGNFLVSILYVGKFWTYFGRVICKLGELHIVVNGQILNKWCSGHLVTLLISYLPKHLSIRWNNLMLLKC